MASQDWFDKDFYKTLGVSKDVSEAELKKTYRKLARKYHPDSNPGDAGAEAKFKEISEAYSVLSDTEQRKEYDAIRAMGGGARFTAGGQSGGFEDMLVASSIRAAANGSASSRAVPDSKTCSAECSVAVGSVKRPAATADTVHRQRVKICTRRRRSIL